MSYFTTLGIESIADYSTGRKWQLVTFADGSMAYCENGKRILLDFDAYQAKPNVTLTCKHCKRVFVREYPQQVVCSQECRRKRYNQRIDEWKKTHAYMDNYQRRGRKKRSTGLNTLLQS